LPLLSRKLLLLVTVERFSVSRAAELLEMPEREAEVHLAGARVQLSGFTAAFRGAHLEPVSQEQAA
jgi:DNA-directed RNA polymerase specialized sigma24 family protein